MMKSLLLRATRIRTPAIIAVSYLPPLVVLTLLHALPARGRAATTPELHAETLDAWDGYVTHTEQRIESELESGAGFLVLDFMDPSERSRCRETIEKGEVCILKRETRDEEGNTVKVPKGMVHHWYGSMLVPGAQLEEVIRFVQSYSDRHLFFDEVESSRLISRDGEVFDIALRLVRTKVITVHYDTEHRVTYRRFGPDAVSARSVATRIQEIDHPGSEKESARPEGEDRGYLWRLNSYWRFRQVEEGTLVECESLSLSRGVPRAVRWLVRSFLTSVPKESLEATLLPLRRLGKPLTNRFGIHRNR